MARTKEEIRQAAKDNYQYYKNRGICVQCRTNKARTGGVHCEDCSKARSEYNLRYYQEKRNELKAKRMKRAKFEPVETGGPVKELYGLGERIKHLREEQNISQWQLAVAICNNVNSSTISHWEVGVTTPNARYIIRLAKYFNVSADYILGLTEEA
jgi:ribosome-binding protein aMBF1 (putative translation factor)